MIRVFELQRWIYSAPFSKQIGTFGLLAFKRLVDGWMPLRALADAPGLRYPIFHLSPISCFCHIPLIIDRANASKTRGWLTIVKIASSTRVFINDNLQNLSRWQKGVIDLGQGMCCVRCWQGGVNNKGRWRQRGGTQFLNKMPELDVSTQLYQLKQYI